MVEHWKAIERTWARCRELEQRDEELLQEALKQLVLKSFKTLPILFLDVALFIPPYCLV